MLSLERVMPVFLGNNFNAYTMAESFHRAFGITSLCVDDGKCLLTENSSIMDVYVIDDFTESDVFVNVLEEIHDENEDDYDYFPLVVFDRRYRELVDENSEILKDKYLITMHTGRRELDLEEIHDLCSECGIGFPETAFIAIDRADETIPGREHFPLLIKPADHEDLVRVEASARETERLGNAFLARDADEYREIIAFLKGLGPIETIAVQKIIGGPVSNERVYYAYINQARELKMLCCGKPLLKKKRSDETGEYLAVMNCSENEGEQVPESWLKFFESIDYTGPLGMVMKRDPEDGESKLISLHLYPDQTMAFAIAAGLNPALPLVDEFILDREVPLQTAAAPYMWIVLEPEETYEFIREESDKNCFADFVAENDYVDALDYIDDMSFMRRRHIKRYIEQLAEQKDL